MNDLEKQERLLDLLTEETVYGLSAENKRELEDLLKIFPEWKEDETLALTAAAITMSGFKTVETMPNHLEAKILANSEKFLVQQKENGRVTDFRAESKSDSAAAAETGGGFFERLFKNNWLGWAAAAAACIALALNLWLTRAPRDEIIVQNPPVQITPTPTPALNQQREQLLASATDEVQLAWTDFDPKRPRGIQGDVVWSNAEQKGFVRFRNLPVNDQTKETYQLWVFDETQQKPVSAGVFDATQAGEIIVPLDVSLRIQKPTMIAITAEKPGGVVVSELGKVIAVAKVAA